MDVVLSRPIGGMPQSVLFEGEHADVKAWLETPGNLNDEDMQARFGTEAVAPFTMRVMFATEYLDNYDAAYPNG